jgi:hypothetical protein
VPWADRSGNIVIAQATTRPDDFDKSNSFDGPRLIASGC